MKPGEMEITVSVKVEQDDTDLKGNVSAIDFDTDHKAEQWVIKELNRGNVYAWAYVVVEARWGPFKGSDALGGISYESKEAFEKDILPEMERNALADLKKNMKAAHEEVEAAIEREKLARQGLRRFSKAHIVKLDQTS
jgi:hypothetical protein